MDSGKAKGEEKTPFSFAVRTGITKNRSTWLNRLVSRTILGSLTLMGYIAMVFAKSRNDIPLVGMIMHEHVDKVRYKGKCEEISNTSARLHIKLSCELH